MQQWKVVIGMDAALITGMFNLQTNIARQPAMDVSEKKNSENFKDVLTGIMGKKENIRKDVNQLEKNDRRDVIEKTNKRDEVKRKDVEHSNIENKDVKNEKVKKKESEKEETDENEKVKEENSEEKINCLIEKLLADVEKETDVNDEELIKDKIGEIAENLGIEIDDKDVKKIMEKVTEKISEKVNEVGPQNVETEKITLKNADDNTEENIEKGSAFTDVSLKDKTEENKQDEDITDVQEEQPVYHNVTDTNKSEQTETKTGKGKENKFNISDFRKKGVEGKNTEQPEFDIDTVKSEIIEGEIELNTNITTRTEDLQKQIDIIKQVSEQIDVNLLEDKSEMVIKLKPDNLGKITMQLSIENGNVVAKFLAESDKVKQALESNFQDLKDNLAKQGLVVQDLSVSVGNENRNNDFGQRGFKSFERRNREVEDVRNDLYYGEGMYYESRNDTARYWPNSTISFSA